MFHFQRRSVVNVALLITLAKILAITLAKILAITLAKTLAITLLGKILQSTQLLIYLKVSDLKYVQILRQWLNIYKY